MMVVVVDKVQNLLPNAVVSSCLNLLGARERKKQYVMVQTMLLEMFGHQIKTEKTINTVQVENPQIKQGRTTSKVTCVGV